MIACSLSTPGMAVGVELNPAPGDGVGEGDGLGAARTTISARFMRAGLFQTWRRRRRSGWRPARRPPPDGSVGRARPAVGSAAGTRARRAPARRGRRRRSAGAERRPAAPAGGRAGRRPSPRPAVVGRPGLAEPGTRAGQPGRGRLPDHDARAGLGAGPGHAVPGLLRPGRPTTAGRGDRRRRTGPTAGAAGRRSAPAHRRLHPRLVGALRARVPAADPAADRALPTDPSGGGRRAGRHPLRRHVWERPARMNLAEMVVLAAPSPSPSPTPSPGAGFNSTPTAIPGVDKLQAIIGYSTWIATAVCLIGLIIAGASMAVAHHHGETVQLGRLGGVVAGCLVVGASSSVVGAILGFNLFTANPEAVPG